MLQADDNNHVNVCMRRTPLYPPHIWNVHGAAVSDAPRTNNFCETSEQRSSTSPEAPKDHVSGQKTIPEFLQGVGHNIRVNKHY